MAVTSDELRMIADRQEPAEQLHDQIVGYYLDGRLTLRELIGQLEATKYVLLDVVLNGGR